MNPFPDAMIKHVERKIVPCPQCKGHGKGMAGGFPVFCVKCRGQGRIVMNIVPKPTTAAFNLKT